MRFLALSLIILTIAFSSLSIAQERCSSLFLSELQITRTEIRVDAQLGHAILNYMHILGKAKSSATALRQETKFVVSEKVVAEQLDQLAVRFGDLFQLRDQRAEGTKNVTVTDYAVPFRIPVPKGELSAKLRARKYLVTSNKVRLGRAKLIRADFVKDRQFVELKIDHPEYGQVVLKPRMVVLDHDVQMMMDKVAFEANRQEILERTLNLSSNVKVDPAVIRQFFEILSIFYSKGPSQLPMFAQTAYVRDSYSVALKNRNGDPVEVQLTVDREIHVTDSSTGKKTSAYRVDDIVVEVKIPLEYSGLTKENLADVPGLADVVALKNSLENAHIDLYKKGSGKLSTFRRTLRDLE